MCIERVARADRMMALDQLRSYSDSVGPAKLSSPRIFLFRMLVFLTLGAPYEPFGSIVGLLHHGFGYPHFDMAGSAVGSELD